MREHPILFSAPMVRAILRGRKTQTRRAMKPQPVWDAAREHWTHESRAGSAVWSGDAPASAALIGLRSECPFGVPGDRLWVRETWAMLEDPGASSTWDLCIPEQMPTSEDTWLGHVPTAIYRADGERPDVRSGHCSAMRWRPSIYMPRWASRITLEVTSVRVERVQAISEEDARAEGVFHDGTWWRAGTHPVKGTLQCWPSARLGYERIWGEINGTESWDANPWVWVVGFRRVT